MFVLQDMNGRANTGRSQFVLLVNSCQNVECYKSSDSSSTNSSFGLAIDHFIPVRHALRNLCVLNMTWDAMSYSNLFLRGAVRI